MLDDFLLRVVRNTVEEAFRRSTQLDSHICRTIDLPLSLYQKTILSFLKKLCETDSLLAGILTIDPAICLFIIYFLLH